MSLNASVYWWGIIIAIEIGATFSQETNVWTNIYAHKSWGVIICICAVYSKQCNIQQQQQKCFLSTPNSQHDILPIILYNIDLSISRQSSMWMNYWMKCSMCRYVYSHNKVFNMVRRSVYSVYYSCFYFVCNGNLWAVHFNPSRLCAAHSHYDYYSFGRKKMRTPQRQ